MSKRIRNKRGKQGRGLHNRQYCKERGIVIAKNWRPIKPKKDFWS